MRLVFSSESRFLLGQTCQGTTTSRSRPFAYGPTTKVRMVGVFLGRTVLALVLIILKCSIPRRVWRHYHPWPQRSPNLSKWSTFVLLVVSRPTIVSGSPSPTFYRRLRVGGLALSRIRGSGAAAGDERRWHPSGRDRAQRPSRRGASAPWSHRRRRGRSRGSGPRQVPRGHVPV